MTISIELELNTAETQARLLALIERMDNRRRFFADVGQLLVDSTHERFRSQTGPDGKPWTPLRPNTIKAREKRGRSAIRILSERGLLSGSINYRTTNDSVSIGAVPEYAAIHQLGGTINKAAGTRWMAGRRFARRADAPDGRDVAIKAHTITIPARPYLGISKEDEEDIFDATERWLMS